MTPETVKLLKPALELNAAAGRAASWPVNVSIAVVVPKDPNMVAKLESNQICMD